MKLRCQYCNELAKLNISRWGYFWFCPVCHAKVNCHKGTKIPLGTLANRSLSQKRVRVHELIDPFWKTGKFTRDECYDNMAVFLGIHKAECHIGMFTEKECERLIEVLSK